MTEKACKDCVFVDRHDFEIAGPGGHIAKMHGFYCCIRAPTHRDGFPKVRIDSWCGEFKLKDEE